MLKIYVNPDDVWDYFQKHKAHLADTLDEIAAAETADDEDIGLQVFITEENGYPQISIEYGDEVLEKECAISKNDCIQVVRKMFQMVEKYEPIISDAHTEEDEDTTATVDETDLELVAEREAELQIALEEFLYKVMGCSEGEMEFDETELSEMLDSIEETLYGVFGYLMYRPRIIEDGNGQPRLIEYLFEEDDEI